MGSILQTFEVRVEVKRKGSRHFSSHVGAYIEAGIVRMFHKDARTGDQAMKMCEKYGRPLGYHKVDEDRMRGNAENFLKPNSNPYPNAIAMDELIWQKKTKRAVRIEDRKRDANGA